MSLRLPELEKLQEILPLASDFANVEILHHVPVGDDLFPIHSIVLGSADKTLPVLGLFGGVHGLERIGTQVIVAYLESLFQQLRWDRDLRERFQSVRIVAIPIVNPGGMALGRRSNPRGVDLMRNSPVEALVKPFPVVGGHRLSPELPYFRGDLGSPMEPESQAVVDFVKKEIFPSRASLVLDIHSGFGNFDRLWYPYAKTTDAFPRIKETQNLSNLLSQSYPNHVYKIEPQSVSYTTHGDLWDYLFDDHYVMHGPEGPTFIPWTLEMGSWLWIRKNPIQLFNPLGVFNPVKEHRLRRVLRRHLPLLDFFLRAVKHHDIWTGANL